MEGNTGAGLGRITVNSHLAAENQIILADMAHRHSKRIRRRPSIRAGKGAAGQQNAFVRTQSQRQAKHCRSLLGAHRKYGYFGTCFGFNRQGFFQSVVVVRI